MKGDPWNDERVARLRQAASDGLNAREIGLEFGVSRLTILARACKYKISIGGGQTRRYKPKPPVKHSPRFNPVIRRSVPAVMPAPSPKMERRTAKARASLPSLGLTLLDLTESTCKFSTSGEAVQDYRFCGRPSAEGQPYCEFHCGVAYQMPPPRRRAA